LVAAAIVSIAAVIFEFSPPTLGGKAVSADEWATRFGDSSAWLDIGDSELHSPGFTLMLAEQREPILIDGNANVVHGWKDVRVRGRARLLPNGDLLTLSRTGDVVRYDWSGNQVWKVDRIPGRVPHHDVIALANGNVLTIWSPTESLKHGDELIEFGPDGQIDWRWDSTPFLDTVFAGRPAHALDPTHINSLQELPENRWHDAGDERFAPGNTGRARRPARGGDDPEGPARCRPDLGVQQRLVRGQATVGAASIAHPTHRSCR
jgi:hypothetical protein